jgi:hypothetical protein
MESGTFDFHKMKMVNLGANCKNFANCECNFCLNKITERKMKMEMEHIGISVEEPVKMAQWYLDNLDFNLILQKGDDLQGVSFISDKANRVTLELFALPEVDKYEPDLKSPLKLHFAFNTKDYEGDLKKLTSSGAVFIEECGKKSPGDRICLLKDPWNNIIQLVQRAKPLIEK